jgi:BirA family biotin operon repressor/biotin-[acetyl-CoA-carboxylase] ligase
VIEATPPIVVLGETDSTNAEGVRRAAAGETGPLWIRALRQTKGRGRRGRVWESASGNLFASLILTPDCALETASELAFVAGLATYDAVAEVAPDGRSALLLKWPNDLLADGAKLGGILIETAARKRDGPATLVVGIGINVTTAPQEAGAALAAYNPGVDAETCMRALVASMERWRERWAEGAGFADVREAWLACTAPLARMKRVDIGGKFVDGAFAGIDEKGALLLTTESGQVRVTAGDVFFR